MLFSGTLYDNVALGRPLDRDKVTAALSDARLDGLVARLGGIDAAIAACGANLSTGERQLLAIARVLAGGRSLSVGVVTQAIDSPYYGVALRGIEEVLDAAGYRERRNEALAGIARRAAEEAESGAPPGPMSAMFKYYATELNKTRYEMLIAAEGFNALGWEGEPYTE